MQKNYLINNLSNFTDVMTLEYILNRAREVHSKDLYLGNCGLFNIPQEIFEFTWLEELILIDDFIEYDTWYGKWVHRERHSLNEPNDISVIPKEISNLKNLKKLALGGSNKIIKLENLEPLSTLVGLEKLYLPKNLISDITPLQSLSSLKVLDLRENSIENIQGIDYLLSLNVLNLSGNKIGSIEKLRYHKNLSYLNLSNNNLHTIEPIINLISKGKKVFWSTDDQQGGIFLAQNPIVLPPPEIIKKGNPVILRYFEELEIQGVDFLYEAKLLLVGEGGVGKTSLAYRLVDTGKELPNEEDTTKGIEISQLEFINEDEKKFKVNIWDFGGQEIYHSTHQFFLTKRSLYILVDDTRKDDKTLNDPAFNYWLQVVELLGGESPLLIVQNEKGDRSKDIDLKGMQTRFSFIKERLKTNLFSCNRLEDVKKAIRYHIQKLPHVGEALPKQWLQIRNEINHLRNRYPYISLKEYITLCSKHGIPELNRAIDLSQYLHDLGAILHYFDDPILKNTVILQDSWATNAVYKILDSEAIKSKGGRFNRLDIKKIWSQEDYELKFDELISLMKRFELCYELIGINDSDIEWLAPQLLPTSSPDYNRNRSNDLIVKYKYDFMPKGLLGRFIVRNHRFIQNHNHVWRGGALLEYVESDAEVIEHYLTKEVEIRIKGDNKKDFMAILSENIDNLNSTFFNLKVRKLVGCNCLACQMSSDPFFFSFDVVSTAKQKKIDFLQCQSSFESISVNGLLDDEPTENKIYLNKKNAKKYIEYLQQGDIEIVLADLAPSYDDLKLIAMKFKEGARAFHNGLITYDEHIRVNQQVFHAAVEFIKIECKKLL